MSDLEVKSGNADRKSDCLGHCTVWQRDFTNDVHVTNLLVSQDFRKIVDRRAGNALLVQEATPFLRSALEKERLQNAAQRVLVSRPQRLIKRNRGSLASCGMPTISHRSRQSLSLPAATVNDRSLASNP